MKYVLLIIAVFTVNVVDAQEDEIRVAYHRFDSIAAEYHNKDIEKSVFYYLKALDQAILLKDSSILRFAYYNLASSLLNQGNFQESLGYWNLVLSYSKTGYDSARAISEIGAISVETGDPDQALNYFLEALDLIDTNHEELKARIYNEMGLLYRSINQFEKALEYFKEMSALKRKFKDPKVYRSYMNIGLIHLDQNQYDSAIKYFELSYQGMDKEQELFGISLYNNNMGSAYSDMGQFKKAQPYAQRAIDYKKILGNKNRLANSYNLMSFIQLGLSDYKSAEKYAEMSLSLLDTTTVNNVRYNALRYLVESRVRQKDTTDVVDLVYQMIDVRNTIHDQQKTAAFSEMSAKFDLEKKETELLQKNLALEVAEGQIQKQEILRNSLLAVIFLAIIIVGLIYRNQRLKSKANAELEKKNEEIEALNEAKSRWFVNVSHELRTPLTLVKGPLINAVESEKVNPLVKENLMLAQRNLDNLENLVNEILDLSKMESGKMWLNSSKVDVTKLVRESMAAFDSMAKELKITFQSSVQEGVYMQVDYEKLYKVLTNLISNAFKFTHEDGTVTVSLQTLEKNVLLSVSDTGEGIPDEDIPHIFDRFYQSVNEKKSRQGGTGIGLALSREIAYLHSGDVTVSSEVDKGSIFTLDLPSSLLVDRTDHTDLKQFLEPTEVEELIVFSGFNEGKPSLLLVDDNNDMRSFIKGFMESDYHITEARDGLDAIEKMKIMTPDIILSDIMMPRMDGIDLIKKIKEDDKWRKIPLIALTALAKESDKIYTLQIGVDDYLVKPFNPKELKVRAFNLINNSIERKNASQEEKVFLSHEDELLMKLQREVEDNLSQSNFNVSRLADVAAMSERQLYRTVKQISGLTPSQFVREIRLKKAMLYIEQNRFATISELSHAVGFEYPGYFTSVFEKRFGSKPAEYM